MRNHTIPPITGTKTTTADQTAVAVDDSSSVCRAIDTSATTITVMTRMVLPDQTRSYDGGSKACASEVVRRWDSGDSMATASC